MKMDAFAFGTTNWNDVEEQSIQAKRVSLTGVHSSLVTSLIKSVYAWLSIRLATLRTTGVKKGISFFVWKGS